MTHAPLTHRPWMEAVESKFAALRHVTARMPAAVRASTSGTATEFKGLGFAYAQTHLRQADAYAWSEEPMIACHLASRTVPRDQRFSLASFARNPSWWWFPQGLRWQSINAPSPTGILTAVIAGPVPGLPDGSQNGRLIVSVFSRLNRASFDLAHVRGFDWIEGESIDEMLEGVADEYDELSAMPASRWKLEGTGKDELLAFTREVLLFLLAGDAWLQQRVSPLSCTAGPIERHRRKQFMRENALEAQPSDVKIVELRRIDSPSEGTDGEGHYSCRWVVDGHWTHQAYGSGRALRKLLYINPYVKGPSDKPLRVPKQTVYVVDR